MDKNKCAVVHDLMPLVLDGVASPASRDLVEGHVQECTSCAGDFEAMKQALPREQDNAAGFAAACRKVSRSVSVRRALVIALMCAVILICVIALGQYAHYNMYVNEQDFVPQRAEISTQADGSIVLSCHLDGIHGGLSTILSPHTQEGYVLLTPRISKWRWIIKKPEETFVIEQVSLKMVDGKMYYVDYEPVDDFVMTTKDGKVFGDFMEVTKPVQELRVGTMDDYIVVYRAE